MSAFTFLCDQVTEQECLDRLLFGSNPHPQVIPVLQRIVPGDYLFLYNYETGTLRGAYIALTPLRQNLEPQAWIGSSHPRGFPWQVRVSDRDEFQQVLTADDLSRVGLLRDTRIGLVPHTEFDDAQVSSLLSLFQRRAGMALPTVATDRGAVLIRPTSPVAMAFIFKCDRTTGAHCFDTNIMGAPVQLFRSVVSQVQPSAAVFLWQIEERRLYGVWQAASRGQYDPAGFPEAPEKQLHAVVHCKRSMKLDRGLDEAAVRRILPYDQAMPPYVIRPDYAQRLVDELVRLNSGDELRLSDGEVASIEYVAEDGHRVKSQGELIIDNMLYNRSVLHGYETRIQVGARYIRCDFYLPPTSGRREVFIEYWGMIGDPQYDARRQEKLALYKRAGIQPLELFPRDLMVLPDVWPAKIRNYET